jgi:hypothetical protein
MGDKTVHPYYVRATSASVLAYIVWGSVHRVGLGYRINYSQLQGSPWIRERGCRSSVHRHQASHIILPGPHPLV